MLDHVGIARGVALLAVGALLIAGLAALLQSEYPAPPPPPPPGRLEGAIRSPDLGYTGQGAMAYDTANGYMYAQNGQFAQSLVVVNAAAESLLSPIPLGLNGSWTDPVGIAVDSAADRVFLADGDSGNVTVIDGATDSVLGQIDLGCSFRMNCNLATVATDPSTGWLFIDTVSSNYLGGGNLTVLNTSSDRVVGTIPVGASALVDDPSDRLLYLANAYNGTIAVVDERSLTVEHWFDLGPSNGPQPMTLDPRTGDVLVADNYGSPRSGQPGVSRLHGASLVSSQPSPLPGYYASSIAFDPENRLLYMGGCCEKSWNNLVVVNASTLQFLGALPGDSNPGVLAVDPENGSIWDDSLFGTLYVFSDNPPTTPVSSVWSQVLGETSALYAFLGMAVGACFVAAGAKETWAGRTGGEHRVPRWVLAAERAEERARRTRIERTSTWFWVGVVGLVVIALLVLIAR